MKKISLSLFLLLSLLPVAAITRAQRPLPPPPYILANEDANRSVVTIPPGQTSGTVNLTWDGGKDHPYAEVWVRVDSDDETFMVEQGRGARQATVELGKSYEFKLSDANVLLSSVTVTIRREAASADPQPTKPPSTGVSPAPRPTPPPANSVSGTIRWSKELGLVPMGPHNSRAMIHPCSAFYVAAEDPQNGFKPVTYTDQVASPFRMSETADYYVCSYTLTVPLNKGLNIVPGMGGVLLLPEDDRDPMYISDPWIGGSNSKPPARYKRGFDPAYTSVKLDRRNSRAVFDFELIYVPINPGPK